MGPLDIYKHQLLPQDVGPGQGWAEEAWDPFLGSPKDPPQTCSLPACSPSSQCPGSYPRPGMPFPHPSCPISQQKAQTAPPTPCLLQNRTGIPAGHSQSAFSTHCRGLCPRQVLEQDEGSPQGPTCSRLRLCLFCWLKGLRGQPALNRLMAFSIDLQEEWEAPPVLQHRSCQKQCSVRCTLCPLPSPGAPTPAMELIHGKFWTQVR